MEARKQIITIKIEVLSNDVIQHLLSQIHNNFCASNQFYNGRLVSDDGDTIEWETESKKVKF